MNRSLLALLLVAGWHVAVPAGLRAQAEEATAAARALFQQGSECADADDMPCAADRWRRSVALRDSPVVRYNLATAEQALGHLVVALELFRSVEREEVEPAMHDAAAAAIAELEPRVARATILIDRSDATILLDGRELPPTLWDVPTPVDPGSHRLEATRDGESIASHVFEAEEGAHLSVPFVIPEPSPVVVVVPTPEEAAETVEPAAPEPVVLHDDHSRRRRILGVVLGIAVAVALGVVIAFAARADTATPTPTDLPPLEFP